MSDATKLAKRAQRKHRIRATVSGNADRPRLSVFISNTHVSAQIINDVDGKTLVSASTVAAKDANGSLTEKAAKVGADIAEKAKKAKISKVVFDRSGRKYHGRVKALADAAREKGLEF